MAMLRVPRGDALYTAVFGDPDGEMYDTVMREFICTDHLLVNRLH